MRDDGDERESNFTRENISKIITTKNDERERERERQQSIWRRKR